jgi:hypothetical protein
VSPLSAETSGFNRYTIPDLKIGHVGSDIDNGAGRLVAQHLWLLDETVTNPTVGICVQLLEGASALSKLLSGLALTSLPQIPVASTLTKTSSLPTSGMGVSRISTVSGLRSTQDLFVVILMVIVPYQMGFRRSSRWMLK